MESVQRLQLLMDDDDDGDGDDGDDDAQRALVSSIELKTA